MTPEQIKRVAMQYLSEFQRLGEEPERFVPTENEPHPMEKAARKHAWWMCYEIVCFVDQGEVDKANRWLGFVQGVLWAFGYKTIDEMRDDNLG